MADIKYYNNITNLLYPVYYIPKWRNIIIMAGNTYISSEHIIYL